MLSKLFLSHFKNISGGLEVMAAKELLNRFPTDVRLRQGKMHFEASLEDLRYMHTLRSIDNLYITLADMEIDWNEEVEGNLN